MSGGWFCVPLGVDTVWPLFDEVMRQLPRVGRLDLCWFTLCDG